MQLPFNEEKRPPLLFPLPITLSDIREKYEEKMTPQDMYNEMSKRYQLVFGKMMPGDLVEDTMVSGYRMQGVYIIGYDNTLIPLEGNYEYGTIPEIFLKQFKIEDFHNAETYIYTEQEKDQIFEQLLVNYGGDIYKEEISDHIERLSYWKE